MSANALFEHTLKYIPDGVIALTLEGTITHFNRMAEKLVGKRASAVVGYSISELQTQDMPHSDQRLRRFLDDPTCLAPGEFITERLYLNGRLTNTSIATTYDASQQANGLMIILRDDYLQQFISSTLMEIHTCLTPLKGFSDLILQDVNDVVNERQRQLIEGIKQNAENLDYLINNVSEIVKLATPIVKMRWVWVDVVLVAERIVQKFQNDRAYKPKKLEVLFQADPDIPDIHADPEKIRQVLMRVIENAFNYTPEQGRIIVHITLDQNRDDDAVQVIVSDTGVGIPQDFHERIWQPFERHDHTALTLDVAGIGLGLFIARTLIEMHNGHIWFETEDSVGTTFYITLPVNAHMETALTTQ